MLVPAIAGLPTWPSAADLPALVLVIAGLPLTWPSAADLLALVLVIAGLPTTQPSAADLPARPAADLPPLVHRRLHGLPTTQIHLRLVLLAGLSADLPVLVAAIAGLPTTLLFAARPPVLVRGLAASLLVIRPVFAGLTLPFLLVVAQAVLPPSALQAARELLPSSCLHLLSQILALWLLQRRGLGLLRLGSA